MRKITLFAMLLVGILAGRAQSAIVGTYNGDMNLTHLTGDEATMEAQAVTISEVDGKFNVTFPSFAIMTGTELGEFVVEDVAVVDNADGSFSLTKEPFTITPPASPNGMTSSYGQCTLTGKVYDDGTAEFMVEVKQNLAMALTTAYFFGSSKLPYVGEYTGEVNLTHVDETKVEMGEQTVSVSEADGKINVLFPSFNLVMGTATGEITIEDVTVTSNGDGSYGLSKELFTVSAGFMSCPNSTFSGTIYGDGSVEMTVVVAQQPGMALTTAKFTLGIEEEEPGDEPGDEPIGFEWGTATWNTADNVVYNGIEEFGAAGLTLSYPNPTNFSLTMLHIIAVQCDVYIDDATEPVQHMSTAQASADVLIEYPFVENHSYRIVTTKAQLAQANLATYTTDTLSTSLDSYEISFTINGPELQKTIEVEAWMSLAITNQEYTKTVSKVDVAEICSALGISDISEAAMHPIRPNGSYCDHMDVFDWWRDADGDFTNYRGGWNSIFGGNAFPAVYSIKVNEAADSVSYYFYDIWTEIVEGEEGNSGGSIMTRAPQTVQTTDTVNWDNGDDTFTPYRRTYRVEVGKDYVSEVMYVANMKSVILRATLHFVSEEEWHEKTAIEEPAKVAAEAVEYYSISGVRQEGLQKGINIVRYTDGTTRKVMVK